MDEGECPKKHAAPLKQSYEEASKTKDYGYEIEHERCLEGYIADCDRKIIKAQKRLDDVEPSANEVPQLQNDSKITKEIAELVAKAESLGEEGNVDESLALMNKAEQLKKQQVSDQANSLLNSVLPSGVPDGISIGGQQQKLRVCEICSAYLSLYDSDKRLADHFGGKLHIGYLQIRERLKELKEKKKLKGNDTREKEPQREREKERERDRERDRDRTRNDRDRDRDYDRDRSYSNKRDYRDNDKDRGYRDRDRPRNDRDRGYRR